MNNYKIKNDEIKLEEYNLKLQSLMNKLESGNFDIKTVRNTKFFLACHEILIQKVYYTPQTIEVNEIPLISIK
mgnify:FL=1